MLEVRVGSLVEPEEPCGHPVAVPFGMNTRP